MVCLELQREGTSHFIIAGSEDGDYHMVKWDILGVDGTIEQDELMLVERNRMLDVFICYWICTACMGLCR